MSRAATSDPSAPDPGGAAGAADGHRPAPVGEAGLVRESLRLCDRYVREVVLAFGLCPWAEPAMRAGRVAKRVFPGAVVDPAGVLGTIDALAGRPDPALADERRGDQAGQHDRGGDVEVALFLFPRFAGGWSAFDAFAERVRRADRARRQADSLPPFLVATFHPDSPAPDVLASENLEHRQLTLFLRRSPDPMLQLVRTRTMDRLKANHPDASEALAAATFAALSANGGADARALSLTVRDIHRDRDHAYGR